MIAELLLFASPLLILYGLAQSTEHILNLRQRRRDNGEDLKIYL